MDITLSPAPVGSPTVCSWCKTHAHKEGFAMGPTYDGYGREWICAGCARSLGKAFGMVDRGVYEDLAEIAAEQDRQLVALRAELEVERAPEAKLVTLETAAKLIDLAGERAKRRPQKTTA